MVIAHWKEKLALIPTQPGCYLMSDERGKIIYVGKAVNLRHRVRSYFNRTTETKTSFLVREIADIEYIVTDTANEALLLECNLIKQHQPRYNVLLKDDKAYPYIRLSRDRHPRLSITRSVREDDACYFGPYPHARAAQQTKRLLDRLFPLRKCRTIPKKPCLYYHIKQCLAPCIQEVSREQYGEWEQQIKDLLQGRSTATLNQLRAEMEEAAEKLAFERAQELRDLVRDVEEVTSKQSVVLPDTLHRDVFGWAHSGGWLSVQIFFIRQGNLIERDSHVMQHYGDYKEDLLSYLAQFYQRAPVMPAEILLPPGAEEIATTLAEIVPRSKVALPKQGPKAKLVAMAERNAMLALTEQRELLMHKQHQYSEGMRELGQHLQIPPPRHMEMIDQAHWQGKALVAAVVVFKDGAFIKQEYRRFKLRTAAEGDDYAALREVIRRRYGRFIEDGRALPDLILVDGGKGHVSAALSVLEDELGVEAPLAGLFKDEQHKSKGLVAQSPPLRLLFADHPRLAGVLQKIQAEVHRFAITYHRQLHRTSVQRSRLDDIAGIGPLRKQKLLQHFGSVEAMKKAPWEEYLKAGLSKKLAQQVKEALSAEPPPHGPTARL